jgi:predicted amidohydrolase
MDGQGVSRRGLMGAGVVALALGEAARAQGAVKADAVGTAAAGLSMRGDGTYETVPLAKPVWTLGVAQSRVRPVDATTAASARKGRLENLAHMVELIDAAQAYGGKRDLLFFHEFPLTGYGASWDKAAALRAAITLPGEETEVLARKARQYDCWLVFGSYVRDPDWPDHLLSITTVMDNRGVIVSKGWKARNIVGVFQGFELFTTTVHNVYDRYVEMYGLDAVAPVVRTPLGNLAVTSTQREPALMQALAMKGAEVILRTATGGFSPLDMQATAYYNSVYVAVCNNAISPGISGYFEDAGGGGSAIYGPLGETVAAARTQMEELVRASIPIAAFREKHRQPNVHMELVMPVYEAYRSQQPPNLFWPASPENGAASQRYLADKSRWR